MISLDWKNRLLIDTNDFLERKLPRKEYDIDFIYNAYPSRIDNRIPKEVITFVAKKIAASISKNAKDYMPFYEYLWNKKGENGKFALTIILSVVIKKNTDFFLPYIKEKVLKSKDTHEINLLLNKTIFNLMKKQPRQYIETLISWIDKSPEKTALVIVKLLVKYCKTNPEYVRTIFSKFESKWLNLNPEIIKVNTVFLKSVYTIDPDYYLKVYSNYRNSRNPIAVEILCKSINVYTEGLEASVNNWLKSGNSRIKKAALTASRVLNKKKEEK